MDASWAIIVVVAGASLGALVFGVPILLISANMEQRARDKRSAPLIQKYNEDRERRRMEQFLTGQEFD
jgi:hypothetical protein